MGVMKGWRDNAEEKSRNEENATSTPGETCLHLEQVRSQLTSLGDRGGSQAENEAEVPASCAAAEGMTRTDFSGGVEVGEDSRL